MVGITFDFRMTTILGDTDCSTAHCVSKDYRDIDNVEEAVKMVKKFFANKSFRGQLATFYYIRNDGHRDTTRLYARYDGEYDQIIFEGHGSYTDRLVPKMTAKLIRECYLNCADCAIKYEEEYAEKYKKEHEEKNGKDYDEVGT